MLRLFIVIASSFLMNLLSSCSPKHYSDALTPEQALKAFDLDENFNIEIFASEPFVKDPIDMIFDESGNVFVVEMSSYPYAPEPGKENGKIKILQDSNHDGRIDKSIVFADGLSEVTSMLSWKGGLIVTAAPEILYLKDTNGDFRADIKKVLFSGFFKGNSEAQITALRYNVDNWVYATNYGQDGKINIPGNDTMKALSLNGVDFRFRLDNQQFEPETGSGQFGQTLDEWGHRFVTQNSFHIDQTVIPWRYLMRNPFLPSIISVDISDHEQIMHQVTPAPYWREERTKQRNATYQEQKLDRVEYASGHFTGSAGGIIYGADNFPEAYRGNFFVGDVAGNLVHRDVLSIADSSPVYKASRKDAKPDREFLTSSDPWFRPVNFAVGPDGNLYVIDMYRQHIETPFAIPEELKKDMDFYNGSEYGRIYRIVPKQPSSSAASSANLYGLSSPDLVNLLFSSNQHVRLQAQKIFLERQDKTIIPLIKKMLLTDRIVKGRLNAIYVLEGLNALDAGIIANALQDKHAGTREAAIRLAERFPECTKMILNAAKDTSAQVVLQSCLSSGNLPFSQAAPVLADILMKYGQDFWFRTAVLSSVPGSSIDFLKLLINKDWFADTANQGNQEFIRSFGRITGNKYSNKEIISFIMILSSAPFSKNLHCRKEGLTGLLKGVREANEKSGRNEELEESLKQLVVSGYDNEFNNSINDIIKVLK